MITMVAAEYHLFPPHQMCVAPHCTRTQKGLALHHVRQKQVIVFTLNHGPRMAKAVHLYCAGQFWSYYCLTIH